MKRRPGTLNHDEISALLGIRAGRLPNLLAVLRDKRPLSREMRQEIAAMLATDGHSAWRLELKRRSRGRPTPDRAENQAPQLLPLTPARLSLIASMLGRDSDTTWTLALRRRRAGKLPPTPMRTASRQLAVGEMVAQLLHEGASDHKGAIRALAAKLGIPFTEEPTKMSLRFKTRSERLTRLTVRGRKNAVALVGIIFGLRRSSVQAAYKAHREAARRLEERAK